MIRFINGRVLHRERDQLHHMDESDIVNMTRFSRGESRHHDTNRPDSEQGESDIMILIEADTEQGES